MEIQNLPERVENKLTFEIDQVDLEKMVRFSRAISKHCKYNGYAKLMMDADTNMIYMLVDADRINLILLSDDGYPTSIHNDTPNVIIEFKTLYEIYPKVPSGGYLFVSTVKPHDPNESYSLKMSVYDKNLNTIDVDAINIAETPEIRRMVDFTHAITNLNGDGYSVQLDNFINFITAIKALGSEKTVFRIEEYGKKTDAKENVIFHYDNSEFYDTPETIRYMRTKIEFLATNEKPNETLEKLEKYFDIKYLNVLNAMKRYGSKRLILYRVDTERAPLVGTPRMHPVTITTYMGRKPKYGEKFRHITYLLAPMDMW